MVAAYLIARRATQPDAGGGGCARGGGWRGLQRGSCCGERRQRLVEVLAELKRPQARRVLLSCSADSSIPTASATAMSRWRAAKSRRSASAYRRAKLQQPPPPLPTSSTLITLPPLRPVFLGVSLHFSFPSDFGNEQ